MKPAKLSIPNTSVSSVYLQRDDFFLNRWINTVISAKFLLHLKVSVDLIMPCHPGPSPYFSYISFRCHLAVGTRWNHSNILLMSFITRTSIEPFILSDFLFRTTVVYDFSTHTLQGSHFYCIPSTFLLSLLVLILSIIRQRE